MPDAPTLSFLEYLTRTKQLRASTITAYARDVARFQQHLGEYPEPKHLTSDLLRAYLRGKHPVYQNRVLASLRIWFDYLREHQGIQVDNPAYQLERNKSKPRQGSTLSNKEVARLRDTIKAHARYPERSRNLAILELLLTTDITTMELCALDMNAISFQDEMPVALTVTGWGGKARTLELPKATGLVLKQWLTQRRTLSDLLFSQTTLWETTEMAEPEFFYRYPPPPIEHHSRLWLIALGRKRGWPLDAQGIRFMLEQYRCKAGIKKKITPKQLRNLTPAA